mmetsp:Transcript_62994/g.136774  ORF Transcript_62994/g.136774 Transcript_62994/m.136774 type:complete len:226 (-) Transcript_62994:510-1187(-)
MQAGGDHFPLGSVPPRQSWGADPALGSELLLHRHLPILAVPWVALAPLEAFRQRIQRNTPQHHGAEEASEGVLVKNPAVHAETFLFHVDGNDRGKAKLQRELLLHLKLVTTLEPHESDGVAICLGLFEGCIHNLEESIALLCTALQNVREECQNARAVFAVFLELSIADKLLYLVHLLATKLVQIERLGHVLGFLLQLLGLLLLLLHRCLQLFDLLPSSCNRHCL